VANALREITAADTAEREDMWRRHWDLHNAESQARLDALHASQDSIGHVGDHAVNNYRFYGPIGTRTATGMLLDREAAEESRRKVVVRRDAEDASSRLTATMYHLTKTDLDHQKALDEAAFWCDQVAHRKDTLVSVIHENKDIQKQFEESVVEDRKAREADRIMEAAERNKRYKEMADVRQSRKDAEKEADTTEALRRLEEREAHMQEYKAVERAALEVECDIKKKEMAVLSRIISHQG